MNILVYTFIHCTIIPCTKDTDCYNKLRPDIHTRYCINNTCTKLLPPGQHCTLPTQCASYSFYGPLACSDKCKIENECILSKLMDTTYCCRSIPDNKRCTPSRPSYLSGCGSKQSCLLRNNHYVCSDTNKSTMWILGALLSICGNILINLGVNIQKKSYDTPCIPVYNINTFLIGMCLYILGKVLGYTSYIFGDQSFLAALSATGLVSNSILAPLLNDEVFTYKDLCAILFVFTGTTFIIMNNKISHKRYSLCELLKLYHKPSIIIYFLCLIIGIVVLYLTIKYVESNSSLGTSTSMFHTSTWYSDDSVIIKYCMVLFYIFLSSFIASFTTLSIKSLAEVIQKTVDGDNQFWYYTPYFFICVLCTCTFGQIYWLNKALKRYDALLVVPIFHITWTLLSIVTAGIYFQEFEHYDWTQFRNFFIGVCIIFTGSLFLGSRIINKNRLVSVEEKLD